MGIVRGLGRLHWIFILKGSSDVLKGSGDMGQFRSELTFENGWLGNCNCHYNYW